MQLIINGVDKTFSKPLSIQQILEELQITDKAMAVAVNMEIVKREQWDTFIPKENDKIEILQFVGGG
ncbi:MAG: sulfur carrier protein ThiS [Epsilonproteobacteria bacterium]|nr:sulfur carrier protein ThiS [Campylobacterota bacterium]